jgi:hypothetical protein
MDLASYLQPISIFLEIMIFGIGIGIGVRKKKTFGWFIAFTFGIYVIYDLSAFTGVSLPADVLAVIFLAASLSMLFVAWILYSRE